MTFTGKGVIWNPKAKAPLVNFKHEKEFSTDDEYEIGLLQKALGVHPVFKEIEPKQGLSKKELVAKAKELGIKGSGRMSKDELLEKVGA